MTTIFSNNTISTMIITIVDITKDVAIATNITAKYCCHSYLNC